MFLQFAEARALDRVAAVRVHVERGREVRRADRGVDRLRVEVDVQVIRDIADKRVTSNGGSGCGIALRWTKQCMLVARTTQIARPFRTCCSSAKASTTRVQLIVQRWVCCTVRELWLKMKAQ